MVTCELIGRLGNQLFQIACTIGYAKKFGMEYHIPQHTLNDMTWPPVFTNLANENYNPLLPTIRIEENGHGYQEFAPINSTSDINICIKGYRQSYKYFEHCIDDVRDALNIPTVINTDTCAVHMRYGDYRQYPKHHPIQPKEYFDNCIDEMYSNGIKDFVFFSDEPDMCWQYIHKCHLPIKASVYDSQNALECFYQLCTYENIITTNSTYSLTAAMMNRSHEILKQVYSPHYTQFWGVDNKHLESPDLIPKYFKQVKY